MEDRRERVKRELLLEGLDCANCAMKIENGVKSLEGIDRCTVNFATKMLIFDVEMNEEEKALESVKKKVHSLDSHIKIKEKGVETHTLYLHGLDCAHCAGKIESEMGKIPAVQKASVDFVSKMLHITLAPEASWNREKEKVIQRINKIESGITVEEEESASKEKNEHRCSILWRLGGGVLLTGIAMFASLPFPFEFALFLIAYAIAGGDVVYRAIRNIIRGRVFDEHFLMTIATIGAFLIGEYAEGVAVMLFYQTGEWFQSLAVNRSRKSISEMMNIRPDYANLKEGEGNKKVSPEEVKQGDIIVVKPGEKIPLDGMVLNGSSSVDTSALTGESLPREVEKGSEVLSGFVNKQGLLEVTVTKEYGESTVSKILDLVQNASSRKAPTENFITKFARYYTPIVVIIAFLLAFLPPLLFTGATLADWTYRALVFLVISCPCALVVSIPLTFFGGIGAASRRGILVKGGNYLEALNDVRYVVFDKTGTLTEGVFEVVHVHAEKSFTKEQVLYYAAYAEQHSNHPIAESVKKAYNGKVNEGLITSYSEKAGHGIEAVVDEEQVLAGNEKLMNLYSISYSRASEYGTIIYVAVNNRYAGYLVISDKIKQDAKEALKSLKRLGIKKTMMLTGDQKSVGENVGKQLGIDEVYAELLPQHKVEKVEELDKAKEKAEKLIFVGDGLNDTPVLARADVGVAMGGLGSDAAIEAADIVIMTDEPSKIAEAISLAKRTRKIVWQNISFALGVKAIFLLLGAFGIATMWEAVFSDVGVTLLAVLNAMRILKR